jgi:predicted DsbA family dithiol-disulfide isomerase
MKRKTFTLFVLICLIAIAAVSASSQARGASFNLLSRSEMESLLTDIAKTNPDAVRKLADPVAKRQQIEGFKQLLAFASEALAEGLASDPTHMQEMESIRAEVFARNYDNEINKGKGPMPAFGYITEERIEKYWGEQTHETEFQSFLAAKTAILKGSDASLNDRELSEEEELQARELFAKMQIYLAEYELKAKNGTISKELIEKGNLQVKLQQAQFLARIYSEKAADQGNVTEKEVTLYIAAHPKLKRPAARIELEKAKDKQLADDLIVKHKIQVAEDFTIPTVRAEPVTKPGSRKPKN